MNNIAEMIRTDPSMRQSFIDIATQRDPALGQQFTQNLRLLDTVTRTAGLAREEKEAIQRLTDLGFEKKQALVAYLVSDKNEEHATDSLVNNNPENSKDSNIAKAFKTPAIGQLISDNPSLRLGLNDFIAQNDPALAQQIKGNPALFETALQSAALGKPKLEASVGDGTGSNSLPIDRERRVVETLPLSARTSQNTNSPSFHIIKLPALAGNISHLRHLVVEFCIQPLGKTESQAIWWTSYVIISRQGTLTRGSGVYTEWDEFGEVLSHPSTGIIAPRTSGIQIADISKGVLNGNHTNGTVLRVVDLKDMEQNVEIFAVLVASGMHDGAYQVHGQATLEYTKIPSSWLNRVTSSFM
jgi:hypothetical protein